MASDSGRAWCRLPAADVGTLNRTFFTGTQQPTIKRQFMQTAKNVSKEISAHQVRERTNLMYVMNDFPSLYQGTVINEINRLQLFGYPVHILALRQPQDPNHAAAQMLASEITYGLDLQRTRHSVLASNLAVIAQIGFEA